MESDSAQVKTIEPKGDALLSPQAESMDKGQMSPLTGAYLLVVISQPNSDEDKEKIIQRLKTGLLCWDSSSSHVDLNCELLNFTNSPPEGDVAKNGEKLLQWASENLVVEVLIHSQVNTLIQCLKNLLSSFTRYRHVIHSGYSFQGSGSWILQDGTFSVADFTELWDEPEVYRLLPAYKSDIHVSLNCATDNGWSDSTFRKEPWTKLCQLVVNGPSNLSQIHNAGINAFVEYLGSLITVSPLTDLLQPSEIVGNIRFTHPTLYVFPGGQGDAALFGVNGFNMLIDGGYARKACFWDFTRHLDRLDAVLLTRVNNNDTGGIGALLERKNASQVFPQIGYFFGNVMDKKGGETKEKRDDLILSLTDQGYHMFENLRSMNLKPHFCMRENMIEPINLYHKVGHGKLDMYILNPVKDSKELKEFLSKWKADNGSQFATGKGRAGERDTPFPVLNLVSICALIVWQPANPHSPITRILFPGSTPQSKIFDSLGKLKHLEFLRYPVCTGKSLAAAHKSTVKSEKIITEVKKELKSRDGSYSITTIESKVTKSVPKETKTGHNKKQQLIGSGGRTETNSTASLTTGGDGVVKEDESLIKKEPTRKAEKVKTVSKVTSTTTTSSAILDNKVRESRLSKFQSTTKAPTKPPTKSISSSVPPAGSKKESKESIPSPSPTKDLNGTEKPASKYGISKAMAKTVEKSHVTSSPKQSKEDSNRKVIEHKTRTVAPTPSSKTLSESKPKVESKLASKESKPVGSRVPAKSAEKTKPTTAAKPPKSNEERPVSKIRPSTAKPSGPKGGSKEEPIKNGVSTKDKVIGTAALGTAAALTSLAVTETKDSKLDEGENEEKDVTSKSASEETSPNSIIHVQLDVGGEPTGEKKDEIEEVKGNEELIESGSTSLETESVTEMDRPPTVDSVTESKDPFYVPATPSPADLETPKAKAYLGGSIVGDEDEEEEEYLVVEKSMEEEPGDQYENGRGSSALDIELEEPHFSSLPPFPTLDSHQQKSVEEPMIVKMEKTQTFQMPPAETVIERSEPVSTRIDEKIPSPKIGSPAAKLSGTESLAGKLEFEIEKRADDNDELEDSLEVEGREIESQDPESESLEYDNEPPKEPGDRGNEQSPPHEHMTKKQENNAKLEPHAEKVETKESTTTEEKDEVLQRIIDSFQPELGTESVGKAVTLPHGEEAPVLESHESKMSHDLPVYEEKLVKVEMKPTESATPSTKPVDTVDTVDTGITQMNVEQFLEGIEAKLDLESDKDEQPPSLPSFLPEAEVARSGSGVSNLSGTFNLQSATGEEAHDDSKVSLSTSDSVPFPDERDISSQQSDLEGLPVDEDTLKPIIPQAQPDLPTSDDKKGDASTEKEKERIDDENIEKGEEEERKFGTCDDIDPERLKSLEEAIIQEAETERLYAESTIKIPTPVTETKKADGDDIEAPIVRRTVSLTYDETVSSIPEQISVEMDTIPEVKTDQKMKGDGFNIDEQLDAHSTTDAMVAKLETQVKETSVSSIQIEKFHHEEIRTETLEQREEKVPDKGVDEKAVYLPGKEGDDHSQEKDKKEEIVIEAKVDEKHPALTLDSKDEGLVSRLDGEGKPDEKEPILSKEIGQVIAPVKEDKESIAPTQEVLSKPDQDKKDAETRDVALGKMEPVPAETKVEKETLPAEVEKPAELSPVGHEQQKILPEGTTQLESQILHAKQEVHELISSTDERIERESSTMKVEVEQKISSVEKSETKIVAEKTSESQEYSAIKESNFKAEDPPKQTPSQNEKEEIFVPENVEKEKSDELRGEYTKNEDVKPAPIKHMDESPEKQKDQVLSDKKEKSPFPDEEKMPEKDKPILTKPNETPALGKEQIQMKEMEETPEKQKAQTAVTEEISIQSTQVAVTQVKSTEQSVVTEMEQIIVKEPEHVPAKEGKTSSEEKQRSPVQEEAQNVEVDKEQIPSKVEELIEKIDEKIVLNDKEQRLVKEKEPALIGELEQAPVEKQDKTLEELKKTSAEEGQSLLQTEDKVPLVEKKSTPESKEEIPTETEQNSPNKNEPTSIEVKEQSPAKEEKYSAGKEERAPVIEKEQVPTSDKEQPITAKTGVLVVEREQSIAEIQTTSEEKKQILVTQIEKSPVKKTEQIPDTEVKPSPEKVEKIPAEKEKPHAEKVEKASIEAEKESPITGKEEKATIETEQSTTTKEQSPAKEKAHDLMLDVGHTLPEVKGESPAGGIEEISVPQNERPPAVETKLKIEEKTSIEDKKQTTAIKQEIIVEAKEQAPLPIDKEQTPAVAKEQPSAETKEQSPAVVNEQPCAEAKEQSPVVPEEQLSTVAKDQTTAVVKEQSHVADKEQTLVVNKELSPALPKEEPSAEAKEQPPTEAKEQPPSVTEGESPAVPKEQPNAETKEQPPAVAKELPPAVPKEQPSAGIKEQPPAVAEKQPSAETEEQPPAVAKELSPAVPKEEPSAEVKEQLPTEAKEQRPFVTEGESPAVAKEQPYAETEEQPPAVAKEQPSAGVKEQPPAVEEEQPSAEVKEQPPAVEEKQPPVEANEQPSTVDKDQPSAIVKEQIPAADEEQTLVVDKEQPSALTKEETSAEVKEQPPAKAKEQPPAVAKEQPSAETKDQPPAVAKEQPCAENKEQSPAVVEEQLSTVVKDQPSAVVKEQSPVADKEQTLVVDKEQPSVEVKELPPTAAKGPPSAVAKEQSPALEKEITPLDKEQPPAEIKEKLPAEPKEQPSADVKEQPLVEAKEQPSAADKDQPTAEVKEQPPAGVNRQIPATHKEQPFSLGMEQVVAVDKERSIEDDKEQLFSAGMERLPAKDKEQSPVAGKEKSPEREKDPHAEPIQAKEKEQIPEEKQPGTESLYAKTELKEEKSSKKDKTEILEELLISHGEQILQKGVEILVKEKEDPSSLDSGDVMSKLNDETLSKKVEQTTVHAKEKIISKEMEQVLAKESDAQFQVTEDKEKVLLKEELSLAKHEKEEHIFMRKEATVLSHKKDERLVENKETVILTSAEEKVLGKGEQILEKLVEQIPENESSKLAPSSHENVADFSINKEDKTPIIEKLEVGLEKLEEKAAAKVEQIEVLVKKEASVVQEKVESFLAKETHELVAEKDVTIPGEKSDKVILPKNDDEIVKGKVDPISSKAELVPAKAEKEQIPKAIEEQLVSAKEGGEILVQEMQLKEKEIRIMDSEVSVPIIEHSPIPSSSEVNQHGFPPPEQQIKPIEPEPTKETTKDLPQTPTAPSDSKSLRTPDEVAELPIHFEMTSRSPPTSDPSIPTQLNDDSEEEGLENVGIQYPSSIYSPSQSQTKEEQYQDIPKQKQEKVEKIGETEKILEPKSSQMTKETKGSGTEPKDEIEQQPIPSPNLCEKESRPAEKVETTGKPENEPETIIHPLPPDQTLMHETQPEARVPTQSSHELMLQHLNKEDPDDDLNVIEEENENALSPPQAKTPTTSVLITPSTPPVTTDPETGHYRIPAREAVETDIKSKTVTEFTKEVEILHSSLDKSLSSVKETQGVPCDSLAKEILTESQSPVGKNFQTEPNVVESTSPNALSSSPTGTHEVDSEFKPSSEESSLSSSAMTVVSQIIHKAEEEVKIHEERTKEEKKTLFYVGDEDEKQLSAEKSEEDEDDGIYEQDQAEEEMEFAGSAVRTGLLTAAATVSATIIRQQPEVDNTLFSSAHSSAQTSPAGEMVSTVEAQMKEVKENVEALVKKQVDLAGEVFQSLTTTQTHTSPKEEKSETSPPVPVLHDSTRSSIGSEFDDRLQFPGDTSPAHGQPPKQDIIHPLDVTKIEPSAPVLKEELEKVVKDIAQSEPEPKSMSKDDSVEPQFEKTKIIHEEISGTVSTSQVFEKVNQLMTLTMEDSSVKEQEVSVLSKGETLGETTSSHIQEPIFERVRLHKGKEEEPGESIKDQSNERSVPVPSPIESTEDSSISPSKSSGTKTDDTTIPTETKEAPSDFKSGMSAMFSTIKETQKTVVGVGDKLEEHLSKAIDLSPKSTSPPPPGLVQEAGKAITNIIETAVDKTEKIYEKLEGKNEPDSSPSGAQVEGKEDSSRNEKSKTFSLESETLGRKVEETFRGLDEPIKTVSEALSFTTEFTSQLISKDEKTLIETQVSKQLDPSSLIKQSQDPISSSSPHEIHQSEYSGDLNLPDADRKRNISSSSVESQSSDKSQVAVVKRTDAYETSAREETGDDSSRTGSIVTSRRFSSIETPETLIHHEKRRGSDASSAFPLHSEEERVLESHEPRADGEGIIKTSTFQVFEEVKGMLEGVPSEGMVSFRIEKSQEPSTSSFSDSRSYETFIIGRDEHEAQRELIGSDQTPVFELMGKQFKEMSQFSDKNFPTELGGTQPQSIVYYHQTSDSSGEKSDTMREKFTLPSSSFFESGSKEFKEMSQLHSEAEKFKLSGFEGTTSTSLFGPESKEFKEMSQMLSGDGNFQLSSFGDKDSSSEWKVTRVVTTTTKVGDGPPETKSTTVVTSGGTGQESTVESTSSNVTTTAEEEDILKKWGKPLGLPGVHTDEASLEPTEGRMTPRKDGKSSTKTPSTPKSGSTIGKSGKKSSSQYKTKGMKPIYVDLAYVPHHGNSNYADSEFFRLIRSRYYVMSGLEPSREVLDGLLQGKQEWEDKSLEVTIVPTYDTDTLGYWVVDSEVALAENRIDLAPSASRCTINLQDHETSCSAYRLEF